MPDSRNGGQCAWMVRHAALILVAVTACARPSRQRDPAAADAAPTPADAAAAHGPGSGFEVAAAEAGHHIVTIAVTARHVYWIEGTTDGRRTSYLGQVDHDGGDRRFDRAYDHALAVDDDHVYYVAGAGGGTESLARRRHDADVPEILAEVWDVDHLAAVRGAVFWLDRRRIEVDGERRDHARLLWIAAGHPPRIILEADAIELTVYGDRVFVKRGVGAATTVVSFDARGEGEQLHDVGSHPDGFDLHVDARAFYLGTDRITRVPRTGGPSDDVVAGHQLIGGSDTELYAVSAVEPRPAVAIDKQRGTITTLVPEPALQAVRHGDAIFVNLQGRIVRVPAR
jgi:hypothetical protein